MGACGTLEGSQIGVFEKSEQAVVRNEADAALAASRSVGKAFDLAGGDQLVDRASAKSGYFDGLGDSDPFRFDNGVAWLAVGRGYFAHRAQRISKAFARRFLEGKLAMPKVSRFLPRVAAPFATRMNAVARRCSSAATKT